ncbi:unnamed protein product, partial [Adineta steineri]
MDNQAIYRNNLASASSSSVNSSSKPDIVPPTKSRRGRKRVTDPILATQLKYHRRSR